MKLGKTIIISIFLIASVSSVWAWNQGGGGRNHHGYKDCPGINGKGFTDKNNDGICDNYLRGSRNTGQKWRGCMEPAQRMAKRENCPAWQKKQTDNKTDKDSGNRE